jgi:hypothetical protein
MDADPRKAASIRGHISFAASGATGSDWPIPKVLLTFNLRTSYPECGPCPAFSAGQFCPERTLMTITVDDRGTIVLPERTPLWKAISDVAAALPADVANQLPTDGAEQHDHYIYGIPRRSQP